MKLGLATIHRIDKGEILAVPIFQRGNIPEILQISGRNEIGRVARILIRLQRRPRLVIRPKDSCMAVPIGRPVEFCRR